MGVTIYRASGSQTYTYRQYTLQSIPDIYTMYNSPLPLDLLPNTAFPLPSSSLLASPTIATSSKSRSTMRLNYPEEIDLGTFIVERWKQAGVGHVFGVPGDFNLGVSLHARPIFFFRVACSRSSTPFADVCFSSRYDSSSWIISRKTPRSNGSARLAN
jgi:hypothetical protein